MKRCHGYAVEVYHWILGRNEEEDPVDIVPHYFLEEDEAREFFDEIEINADFPQANLYECTLKMEYSRVWGTENDELIDQKF